jgi:alkanesulfonate monooxygenase SsuD/methylene tetrahydromethanopterin reductase-like flavin-dependent oxidoreductase (luciferase family)
MFRREYPPETLPDFARRTEQAGFDELWVVEDCFYGSGIAAAATALANTATVSVGLGIMPAVVRNPVFSAMEIATLARIFPGRFLPGFGHGVAGWMRQIGAFPKSQLKALEEVVITVQRLLAGDQLSFEGTEVQIDQAELVHPPALPPPISLGVRGPKSLALSGRIADGTILAEYAAAEYVSWARQQIARGQQAGGRNESHRLTVFAFTSIDTDVAVARQRLRPLLASAIVAGKIDAQLAPLGILPQVKTLRKNGSAKRLQEELPDEWIDKLAIVGPTDVCLESIRRLVNAGADSVVLVPLPDGDMSELDLFAQCLLS